MPNPPDLKRSVVCSALAAGLFALMQYAMPLGFFGAIMSPLPIAYMAWAGPLPLAAFSTLAAGAVLGLAADPLYSLEFLLQFGLGGLLLGEGLKRERSPAWIVGAFGLISAGIFIGLLAFNIQSTGQSAGELLKTFSTEWLKPIREAVKTEGIDPRELIAAEEYLSTLEWSFTNIPFGIMAGFGLLAGAFNSAVLKRFLKGRGADLPSWTGYSLPGWAVWFLIFTGLGTAVGDGATKLLALNLLIPLVVAYFLQGMLITNHLLDAWRAPPLARIVIMTLVFFELRVFGLLLAAAGAFDQWIDFRNRLAPGKGPEQSGLG